MKLTDALQATRPKEKNITKHLASPRQKSRDHTESKWRPLLHSFTETKRAIKLKYFPNISTHHLFSHLSIISPISGEMHGKYVKHK